MVSAPDAAKQPHLTAVPNSLVGVNPRFLDHKNIRFSAARAPVHLSTPPSQTFVPLGQVHTFRVNIDTPTTFSRNRSRKRNEKAAGIDSAGGAEHGPSKRFRYFDDAEELKRTSARAAKPVPRLSKPLKNAEDIHMDVWRLVLKKTPLKFLLNAKTINRRFYALLNSEQNIWYHSRINQYSDEMPGPPGDFTEQQYAQLLEGKGCQNFNCSRVKTGKVYWAFRARLCEDCLEHKTIRGEAAERYRLQGDEKRELLDLIPAGTIYSGKYSRCSRFDPDTGRWERRSRSTMYLKSDVDNIEAEYEALIAAGQTSTEISEWKDKKKEEAIVLCDELTNIESWVFTRNLNRGQNRTEREIFFREQAAKLSPSMSTEVLNKMLAYKMSLDANTPVTPRMWTVLESKILPYREQAEKLVAYDLEKRYSMSGDEETPNLERFRRLQARRRPGGFVPPKNFCDEQMVVRELAKQELRYWQNDLTNDADLVLKVLRGVWEAYQNTEPRPEGLNANGEMGPYDLTMDDARLILEEVLEPQVKSWHNAHRASVALNSFKCAGCPRKDCTTKYTFVKLFEHIHKKHACYVGEDTEFAMFALPYPRIPSNDQFPWFTVRWPRNLPVLALHQSASRENKWHPDADEPYLEGRKPVGKSAFAGRQVLGNSAINRDDFQGNLVFAAERLKRTALDGRCQTQIILQYAFDRRSSDAVVPTLQQFTSSFKAIQDQNPSLEFKFRCGICLGEGDVPTTSKFIKCPIQFHELEKHYQAQHRDKPWATGMMDLPNEKELHELMLESDAALEQEKKRIQAREESVKASWKKRPCRKAATILKTVPAMTAFDELFPKV